MMTTTRFINVYDTYCPMLFDMALQICRSYKKAEDLLSYTFVKFHEQQVNERQYPAFCITLMQLVIKSGRELYPQRFKKEFRLKQFAQTPFINQIICEQISLQDYCNENFLTRQQALDVIQQEFSLIRNAEKENKVAAVSKEPVLA